ncbi:MAG: tetratricopeptide repeat protein [Pyrinomonadaceae bacterium]
MGQIVDTNDRVAAIGGEEISELLREPVWMRVAPNSYMAAVFVTAFFGLLFFELGYLVVTLPLLGLAFIAFPLAYYFDRIVFDGKSLARSGVIPRVWEMFGGMPNRLPKDDIEMVETQAVRALKRGGSVFYRYRTSVSCGRIVFVMNSGGESYRRMIRNLFPRLAENLLDNRSIELRDYLSEPKETLMKAEFARIPSTDVLEESIRDFDRLRTSGKEKPEFGDAEVEKADYLRRLANELRLSGYLLQALEAFRRALYLNPNDAWLLFEFARCLHSFAGSERDARLERRALAVLRLAELRGKGDTKLLSRVGESYFQYGEQSRALKVFQRLLDGAEESFRVVRGMAEIALREGKLAHVIHHFSNAGRVAETPALRRWSQTESEYFSRLNNDAEYMDTEVSRVRLLETLEGAKRTALKIALGALPAIFIGSLLDMDLLKILGWAVSCTGVLIWAGIFVSINLLSERAPLSEA